MKKTIFSYWITLALGMFFMPGALAQTAVFTDNVLTLEDALVVENGVAQYYRDVRLDYSSEGSFRVAEAQAATLAPVSELSVGVFMTEPVEVEIQVSGELANPCIELETAKISVVGNTFYVTIAERHLQTLVACAQVITPWEKSMPLDVSGLPAGDYWVVVNGTEIDFTLE